MTTNGVDYPLAAGACPLCGEFQSTMTDATGEAERACEECGEPLRFAVTVEPRNVCDSGGGQS